MLSVPLMITCPPTPTSSTWPRRVALVGLFGGALLIVGSCSRSPVPPARPVPAVVGPRATVERLTALRGERRYAQLRELVIPESTHEVVVTLMAVDEFLDANRRLCDWIRDNVGIGLSQSIDQSHIAEVLGIFSRYVELLDESVTGGEASISFIVDGRLPTQRALLRKTHGVWRYDPEGGYSEHLPEAFREMARGLDQVLADLESGRISSSELRTTPEMLGERVKVKLRRGVRLLSKARDAARAAEDE